MGNVSGYVSVEVKSTDTVRVWLCVPRLTVVDIMVPAAKRFPLPKALTAPKCLPSAVVMSMLRVWQTAISKGAAAAHSVKVASGAISPDSSTVSSMVFDICSPATSTEPSVRSMVCEAASAVVVGAVIVAEVIPDMVLPVAL